MPIDQQAAREATTDVILKCITIAFFFTCLWLNYPLDRNAHFVWSHLATLVLLAIVPATALYKTRVRIYKPWGTRWDYAIWAVILVFMSIRSLQSIDNQFFFGQFSKLVLIVMGWTCFKALDPDGKLLNFFALWLPIILAAGITMGAIIWLASGKIGFERFRIGPNDYEYVSEYAGLMLPLVLFSLEGFRRPLQRLILLIVLFVVFAGLVLTGARGPLLGGLIAVLSYGYLARKRMQKSIWAVVVISFVLILVVLGSTAYASSSAGDVNRFVFDESSSLERFSSGRWSNWVFLVGEMLSNTSWIVFGSGLGRLAEWIPSDGGFFRPAVTNGLLAAWVPFGIVGLIAYLYFCRYLWRRLSSMIESPYRCMAMSLFFAYLLTDQFETHWQGTNMLWYVSFVLYVLTLARPRLPARLVVSSAHGYALSQK